MSKPIHVVLTNEGFPFYVADYHIGPGDSLTIDFDDRPLIVTDQSKRPIAVRTGRRWYRIAEEIEEPR